MLLLLGLAEMGVGVLACEVEVLGCEFAEVLVGGPLVGA